ncbi:hypothetical protein DPMN_011789 [Dreissena polymorpha]|uniref:Uncharacterized protein n=1 Tax=Dreissena polymorpha TaxID=45954 RepID=A0A9D4N4S6_DREPO|nr:hypothetical protein DPMN_011789 [Dreissena polymorpha]
MNIYVTRCKFVVNGRNINLYTDNDIFKIQNIVFSARRDETIVHVAVINRLLAEGIENIMNEKTRGSVIDKKKKVITNKQTANIKNNEVKD